MNYPMEFTRSEIFVLQCALERQADSDDGDPGIQRLAKMAGDLCDRLPLTRMNWDEFVRTEVK